MPRKIYRKRRPKNYVNPWGSRVKLRYGETEEEKKRRSTKWDYAKKIGRIAVSPVLWTGKQLGRGAVGAARFAYNNPRTTAALAGTALALGAYYNRDKFAPAIHQLIMKNIPSVRRIIADNAPTLKKTTSRDVGQSVKSVVAPLVGERIADNVGNAVTDTVSTVYHTIPTGFAHNVENVAIASGEVGRYVEPTKHIVRSLRKLYNGEFGWGFLNDLYDLGVGIGKAGKVAGDFAATTYLKDRYQDPYYKLYYTEIEPNPDKIAHAEQWLSSRGYLPGTEYADVWGLSSNPTTA